MSLKRPHLFERPHPLPGLTTLNYIATGLTCPARLPHSNHGSGKWHYDEAKVLCYLCSKAVGDKNIATKPGSSDDALVSYKHYSY